MSRSFIQVYAFHGDHGIVTAVSDEPRASEVNAGVGISHYSVSSKLEPQIGDGFSQGMVMKETVFDLPTIKRLMIGLIETAYEASTNALELNPSNTRLLEYEEKRGAALEFLDAGTDPLIRAHAETALGFMVTDLNRDAIEAAAADAEQSVPTYLAHSILTAATQKRALLFTAGEFRSYATKAVMAAPDYLTAIALLDQLSAELQALIRDYTGEAEPDVPEDEPPAENDPAVGVEVDVESDGEVELPEGSETDPESDPPADPVTDPQTDPETPEEGATS